MLKEQLVANMWGNILIDWVAIPSIALSGGILMMWKKYLWGVKHRIHGDRFVGVCVWNGGLWFCFACVYMHLRIQRVENNCGMSYAALRA